MTDRCRPDRRWWAATAVLVLAMTFGACGDDGAADPTTSTRPPTTTEPAPPLPTCEDGTLDGRRFVLCTAGDDPDQRLVVALHGRGSSAAEMQGATRLEHHAAAGGVAVVFPDAVDGGWGDDTFPTPTRPAGDEDLVALDGLIESVRRDDRVDDDRPVAVVGFSNGASMALRYASQRADDVSAVVSVAGQLPRDPAIRPSGRVPLLEIYGSADPIRPYGTGIADPPSRQAGGSTPTLPTPDTVAAFVGVTGGEATEPHESDPEPTDATRLRTERWTDRSGTVAELVTVIDGGHTWPSAAAPFTGSERFGPTSRDLDAGAAAIEFIVATSGDR